MTREELPGLPLRACTYGHSIQGEMVSETDARLHLTTHEVDTLGRRTATVLPAVDNATARLETEYDDTLDEDWDTHKSPRLCGGEDCPV